MVVGYSPQAALAMLTSGSDTDTDLEGATVPKSPVDDYLNDALGQSPGHCNSSGHDPVHRGFKFSGPLDDSAPSEEEKDIASGDDSESARLSEPSSMSRRSPGRGPRPSVLARCVWNAAGFGACDAHGRGAAECCPGCILLID